MPLDRLHGPSTTQTSTTQKSPSPTGAATQSSRSAEVRAAIEKSSGADRGDLFFRSLALSSGATVLFILAAITVSTAWESWPAFRQEGMAFVTSTDWNPNTNQFGALAFIYGTILVSTIALLMSVPVSLGIALFSTEVAPRRMRSAIGFVIDLLAAIPSVVYGLWGVLVLAPNIAPAYSWISSTVGDWPVLRWFFAPPSNGTSYMTAGIILAFMITPIITSISREVIKTVPAQQREAALALGATRWEMIRGAILPWSRGGITGATMLGLGRAMGETIAVALVIGSSPQITTRVFASGDAMAGYIANQFGEASGTFRSALVGLGLVLFLVTILVNVSAQRIISGFDKRMQRA